MRPGMYFSILKNHARTPFNGPSRFVVTISVS